MKVNQNSINLTMNKQTNSTYIFERSHIGAVSI